MGYKSPQDVSTLKVEDENDWANDDGSNMQNIRSFEEINVDDPGEIKPLETPNQRGGLWPFGWLTRDKSIAPEDDPKLFSLWLLGSPGENVGDKGPNYFKNFFNKRKITTFGEFKPERLGGKFKYKVNRAKDPKTGKKTGKILRTERYKPFNNRILHEKIKSFSDGTGTGLSEMEKDFIETQSSKYLEKDEGVEISERSKIWIQVQHQANKFLKDYKTQEAKANAISIDCSNKYSSEDCTKFGNKYQNTDGKPKCIWTENGTYRSKFMKFITHQKGKCLENPEHSIYLTPSKELLESTIVALFKEIEKNNSSHKGTDVSKIYRKIELDCITLIETNLGYIENDLNNSTDEYYKSIEEAKIDNNVAEEWDNGMRRKVMNDITRLEVVQHCILKFTSKFGIASSSNISKMNSKLEKVKELIDKMNILKNKGEMGYWMDLQRDLNGWTEDSVPGEFKVIKNYTGFENLDDEYNTVKNSPQRIYIYEDNLDQNNKFKKSKVAGDPIIDEQEFTKLRSLPNAYPIRTGTQLFKPFTRDPSDSEKEHCPDFGKECIREDIQLIRRDVGEALALKDKNRFISLVIPYILVNGKEKINIGMSEKQDLYNTNREVWEFLQEEIDLLVDDIETGTYNTVFGIPTSRTIPGTTQKDIIERSIGSGTGVNNLGDVLSDAISGNMGPHPPNFGFKIDKLTNNNRAKMTPEMLTEYNKAPEKLQVKNNLAALADDFALFGISSPTKEGAERAIKEGEAILLSRKNNNLQNNSQYKLPEITNMGVFDSRPWWINKEKIAVQIALHDFLRVIQILEEDEFTVEMLESKIKDKTISIKSSNTNKRRKEKETDIKKLTVIRDLLSEGVIHYPYYDENEDEAEDNNENDPKEALKIAEKIKELEKLIENNSLTNSEMSLETPEKNIASSGQELSGEKSSNLPINQNLSEYEDNMENEGDGENNNENNENNEGDGENNDNNNNNNNNNNENNLGWLTGAGKTFCKYTKKISKNIKKSDISTLKKKKKKKKN